MSDSITGGLISGLLIALFLVVFRSLWIRIIVPWFEERVYKDAKIEGKWFSFWPTDRNKRQEVVNLTRHGHDITGTLVCTSGNDSGERYDLSGSFRNLILALIYETSDKSKTDRGTITLKLMNNAERFEGKLAAYHTEGDEIGQMTVIWFRSKDHLDKYTAALATREEQVNEFRNRQHQADEVVRQLKGEQTPNENKEQKPSEKENGKPPRGQN